ncbi:MAG: hypothetical protein WC223_03790 [Bacteroidales bacterium]|jgi:hypothetical protein
MNTLNIPIEVSRIFNVLRNLPYNERKKLANKLLRVKNIKESTRDFTFTHLASETALAKDWLKPEEDEAWKNL